MRDSTEHVEVHLLSFRGDLYGRDLEVFFLTRLRDERAFAGKDALLAAARRGPARPSRRS